MIEGRTRFNRGRERRKRELMEKVGDTISETSCERRERGRELGG